VFEPLLKAINRACEIPTLSTPSPVAKRSFGGLEIFDGSKPMICLYQLNGLRNGQSCTQSYKETDLA
jgi:hypothetical protein